MNTSDCQFGFRSKRNSIMQLLDVFDNWVKAYDEGYQIDAVFLDFLFKQPSLHAKLLTKLRGIALMIHL